MAQAMRAVAVHDEKATDLISNAYQSNEENRDDRSRLLKDAAKYHSEVADDMRKQSEGIRRKKMKEGMEDKGKGLGRASKD